MKQLAILSLFCFLPTEVLAQNAQQIISGMEPKVVECGMYRGQQFTSYFRVKGNNLEFDGVSPQTQPTPTTYSVPLSDRIRIDPDFVDNRLSVEFYCTDGSACMRRKEGSGSLESTSRVKLTLMPTQQSGSCSRSQLEELRQRFVALGK